MNVPSDENRLELLQEISDARQAKRIAQQRVDIAANALATMTADLAEVESDLHNLLINFNALETKEK
jgi:hypothetical protein